MVAREPVQWQSCFTPANTSDPSERLITRNYWFIISIKRHECRKARSLFSVRVFFLTWNINLGSNMRRLIHFVRRPRGFVSTSVSIASWCLFSGFLDGMKISCAMTNEIQDYLICQQKYLAINRKLFNFPLTFLSESRTQRNGWVISTR